MFKDIILNNIKRAEEKKANLTERVEKSENVDEVRALTKEVDEINKELAELRKELTLIEEREKEVPKNAVKVNDIKNVETFNLEKKSDDVNVYSTIEYRKAFMEYAQRGTAIPSNLIKRDSANTSTLGATIPTTVLNEFINEIRLRYGNLYNKVRKMNIKGAVKVPIARLQAQFKWVSENTVAPKEDGGTINEYVEFSYNLAEIRVAQTLLSSIVTLDIFEREIVNVMLIAFLRAMDTCIIKGNGNGQMLGILNDPRVLATGNVVEMTEADMNDWTAWRKNFFAKLPLGYRDGEFIFPLSTVETYLSTMADANNNPVFQQATGLIVNDGDAINPNGRFFGRNISLVEPDIIQDYDTASEGDVIGIFWQPEEYAINTNMEFGMRRWFDEDTNEWINKMLVVVDGKVLNPMGIWLIKKKVATA